MNNRYQLLKLIGKSESSEVYRGLDVVNRIEVAIKIKNNDEKQEASKHALINHLPIVPKLLDVIFNVNKVYMVTEFINGSNVLNSWKNNKSWDFIWVTIYHMLICLQTLHQAGYIHDDAHLGNFIWTGQKMYIIDFEDLIDFEAEMTRLAEELVTTNLNEEANEYEDSEELPTVDLNGGGNEYEDSDVASQIFNEMEFFEEKFCNDFRTVISSIQELVNEPDIRNYYNFNKGYQKYLHLLNQVSLNKCNDANGQHAYLNYLLKLYEEINIMNFP